MRCRCPQGTSLAWACSCGWPGHRRLPRSGTCHRAAWAPSSPRTECLPCRQCREFRPPGRRAAGSAWARRQRQSGHRAKRPRCDRRAAGPPWRPGTGRDHRWHPSRASATAPPPQRQVRTGCGRCQHRRPPCPEPNNPAASCRSRAPPPDPRSCGRHRAQRLGQRSPSCHWRSHGVCSSCTMSPPRGPRSPCLAGTASPGGACPLPGT
mmetsp:Transcript_47705/g.152206  ORF Transcript_47705/g.152206 Transcript_47705/m.152206 type:complete len:208 (+) Transcript_47705:950-1573(+)